jgi:L-seryl-tRNA(Ser) seleniumtransferase
MPPHHIRRRAEALAERIGKGSSVEQGQSVIGGGSTPDLSLPTWLIVLTHEKAASLERRLRSNNPPIISRIERDRVIFDLRTVFPHEEDAIVKAIE